MVMDKLQIEVPSWKLHRRVSISTIADKKKKQVSLFVRGIDDVDRPFNFIPSLDVNFKDSFLGSPTKTSLKSDSNDPYIITRKCNFKEEGKENTDLTLHFVGYFNEPDLTISHSISNANDETIYSLYFEPDERKWEVENESFSNVMDLESKQEENTRCIIIGNSCEKIDDKNYKWTVFVRPEGATMNGIQSVTFHLHPTFHPADVTISKVPFEISRTGWGVFDIEIDVVKNDGSKKKFTHTLSFSVPTFQTYEI